MIRNLKNIARLRNWYIAVALFVIFEALLILFVDRPLSEYLRTVDKQYPAVINFFRAYTDLGNGKWIEWPTAIGAIICLGLSRWRQLQKKTRQMHRREGLMLAFIFASTAIAGILTDILKAVIGRARPVLLERHGIYGFDPLAFHSARDAYNSFPSGHATTAFAFAFALAALWPRARPWFMAFAVAIALSRVMVNAHYLADVFAGALVGSLTALRVKYYFEREGWINAGV